MPTALRRFWPLSLSVVFAVASLSCGSEPLPESDVVLEVDFGAPRQRVGRLIGWNIGSSSLYAPEVGTRHPEWRTPALVEAVKRLGSVRAANGDRPLVRFSGLQIDGILNKDGYHFFDFANPEAPISPHDNMSPSEYMAVVEEVDADPMITLNFGSGTSAEAAEYVRYLNGTDASDPFVAARRAGGRLEPWPTHVFEIGNEVYSFSNAGNGGDGDYSYANPAALHGGDPAWHGKPAKNVEDFAARALEYVERVRAVDETARFYIPLTQGSWDGWGGPAVAIPKMRALLGHEAVVGVVVHQYTFEDGILGHGIQAEPDAWLLASADFFRPLYEELRTLLATIEREKPLEIAMTEYHSVANVLDFERRYGPTPIAALGLADELMLFAEVGIERALQHLSLALSLVKDSYSQSWHVPFGLEGDRLLNRPSFLVTSLVAEHLHRHLVETKAERMPRREYPEQGDLFEYDLVHVAAFVSEAGGEGSVLLLNRDLTEPRSATLRLPRGWSVRAAKQIAPAEPWADVAETEVEVESAAYQVKGDSVRVILPPHSLVALRLGR